MKVCPMSIRRPLVVLRSALRRSQILQIGLFVAFWLAGEAIARLSGLPVPGGVIGMAGVLVLLSSQRLAPVNLRRGAEWLLSNMLLFFVPATMVVLDHREFLGVLGLKLIAVILVSTLCVMGATALAVDACYRGSANRAP
jgi:holin-like protein